MPTAAEDTPVAPRAGRGSRRAARRGQEVMKKLTGQLTAFHTKVGGDVGKISALFSDLTPEPQACAATAAAAAARMRKRFSLGPERRGCCCRARGRARGPLPTSRNARPPAAAAAARRHRTRGRERGGEGAREGGRRAKYREKHGEGSEQRAGTRPWAESKARAEGPAMRGPGHGLRQRARAPRRRPGRSRRG